MCVVSCECVSITGLMMVPEAVVPLYGFTSLFSCHPFSPFSLLATWQWFLDCFVHSPLSLSSSLIFCYSSCIFSSPSLQQGKPPRGFHSVLEPIKSFHVKTLRLRGKSYNLATLCAKWACQGLPSNTVQSWICSPITLYSSYSPLFKQPLLLLICQGNF